MKIPSKKEIDGKCMCGFHCGDGIDEGYNLARAEMLEWMEFE